MFGIGPMELLIIAAILLLTVVPAIAGIGVLAYYFLRKRKPPE